MSGYRSKQQAANDKLNDHTTGCHANINELVKMINNGLTQYQTTDLQTRQRIMKVIAGLCNAHANLLEAQIQQLETETK